MWGRVKKRKKNIQYIVWFSFCATDVFLWKAWMYKLAMLYSHDYFQFKIVSITQFFIQFTLKIFRGHLPSEKVKEFISVSVNFQFSDCYNLWQRFYADKLSTWDFPMVFLRHHVKLDMQENTKYILWLSESRQTRVTNICKFVNFQWRK